MIANIKSKTKRYKEIIQEVKVFLDKLPEMKNSETEYFKSIKQDAEYLHDFINYAIFDIELYKAIKDIYKQIIILLNKKHQPCSAILGELYYTFRYLMESIMFLIENEYLIK